MSVALLLSSAMLFNLKEKLDSESLQSLGFVTKLSKLIKMKDHETIDDEGAEIRNLTPHLTFVVRDSFLKSNQTNDEYLEQALVDQPARNEAMREANTVRQLLRAHFPSRALWRLVRPIDDESKLAHMESVPLGETRLEFAAPFAALRRTMFQRTPCKSFQGSNVNGARLASLLPVIVQGVNTGIGVNVKSAWASIDEEACLKARLGAIELYDGNMNECAKDFPLSVEELFELHANNVSLALSHYSDNATPCAAFDRIKLDLEKSIGSVEEENVTNTLLFKFSSKNNRASEILCRSLRERLVAHVDAAQSFDDFKARHAAALIEFNDEAIGAATIVERTALNEKLESLSKMRAIAAQLDDAQLREEEQKKELRITQLKIKQLEEQTTKERKLYEAQMLDLSNKLEQSQRDHAAQLKALQNDAAAKEARLKLDMERAIASKDEAAKKLAEQDLKRLKEETAASQKAMDMKFNELQRAMITQRENQQHAYERLPQPTFVQSQSKSSTAKQCTGTNWKGTRCGNYRHQLVNGRCEYHR